MKNLLEKINGKLDAQGGFLKAVSVLVGGTAIGQLIAMLALPLLTRLYTPESFSELAVYVSILSMTTVASGLCFEYAIPLPKSDRLAAALCLLAIISTLFFTVITALLLYLLPSTLLDRIVSQQLQSYLWLIPLGIFAVGMYNSLQYWSTRNKRFNLIAKTRITQSLSGTSVKLGAGYLLNGWVGGLILGQLLARGAGFFSLGLFLLKNDRFVFKSLTIKHLRLAFRRYDNFPKYTTLEVFTNTAGVQLPILLIAYYAEKPELGYISVAMQLLSAPMGMLSSAVAQVYLTEGANHFHKGVLKEFTYKTLQKLLKISVLPLLIAAIISPYIIPYILGAEWERTGYLISWMTPWFLMQFIASPVSTVLYITNNQKIAFILQLFGLVLRVGTVYIAAFYASIYIGEIYALSGFAFYSLYLYVVYKVIQN